MREPKVKDAAMEVKELLDRALSISLEKGCAGWVTAWATSQDALGGYGYTVELGEKIQDLEERLEKLQGVEYRLPPLTHLVDSMKLEYFLDHFQEIPLEALEHAGITVGGHHRRNPESGAGRPKISVATETKRI